MNIINRMQAPTPKYFQKLRNIGVLLAGLSGAIATAPVALPLLLSKLAGYLLVAGTVATAVAQSAVAGEPAEDPEGSGEDLNQQDW